MFESFDAKAVHLVPEEPKVNLVANFLPKEKDKPILTGFLGR